jgi:hypothetical protein
MPLGTIVDLLARLSRSAEEAGRDPKDLKLVCRGVTVLTATPAVPGAPPSTGTLEQRISSKGPTPPSRRAVST